MSTWIISKLLLRPNTPPASLELPIIIYCKSGWERRNRLEEAIGKELFSMAHVATKTLLEWLCDPGVIKLGMTMQHKG